MLRLKGGEEDQAPEFTDSQKYDQALWDMLKQHPDEIFFLNTVFNFLQRRTPCFSGPNAERNYEILIDTLTRQKERYLEHIKKGKKPKAPVPMPDKSAPAPKAPSASAPLPARVLPPAQPTEPTEHGAGHTHGADDDCCREVVPAKKTEDSGAGKQLPVDNGGTTDRYRWTQTLKELTMDVWLPAKTTAKQLEVVIAPKTLRVAIKGGSTILEGELEDGVLPAECYWTVEDGALVLTLAKSGDMTWWKTVMRGDPEIDLQKIDPETSNLNDLNPDLRQTVEKMMYDQKQKAMGLPTSEEKQNRERLQKFMEAHPEMDFSKCKF